MWNLAGNTQDLQTVETVVTTIEARFGKSHRVWVMDRGMISAETLAFLSRGGRRYLLATRRGELARFARHLRTGGWKHLPDNPDVAVKLLKRRRVHYLLARSRPRRQKERAIRRRQRRGLARALVKLRTRIESGRLKSRDKILESVGRLKGRFPKERDANNFPICLEYDIKTLDRSATRRSATWTPMHRESNG